MRRGLSTEAIEFDFSARQKRSIPLAEVRAATERGKSCWVDLDLANDAAAEALLVYGLNTAVINEVGFARSVGRYDVYDDCLHVTIAAPRFDAGRVTFEHLDLVMAERVLFTLHRGRPAFLQRVDQRYVTFFQRFAQSLGFLLFDIGDSLIETHRSVLSDIEERVEQTQRLIFTASDDAIFGRVGQGAEDLLHLRKNLLANRDVLDQLATHRSAFVPETTQPYLRNMAGMLDRLADDLTVERETLAEALTLYLGIVSHRTNRLLHRLTLVNVIFLPLMFLCGVYGTNFDRPVYDWKYGYLYFWIVSLVTVGCLIAWLRIRKMW